MLVNFIIHNCVYVLVLYAAFDGFKNVYSVYTGLANGTKGGRDYLRWKRTA
jgi:hypothetical protein